MATAGESTMTESMSTDVFNNSASAAAIIVSPSTASPTTVSSSSSSSSSSTSSSGITSSTSGTETSTSSTTVTHSRITRSSAKSLNSSTSTSSSISTNLSSSPLPSSNAEFSLPLAVSPKEKKRQEVDPVDDDATPRRRSQRLLRRRSGSPIDSTMESDADVSITDSSFTVDNPSSPSSSLSAASSSTASSSSSSSTATLLTATLSATPTSSTASSRPNTRSTKRGASSPNGSSATCPASTKKLRSQSPKASSSLSPSEILDLNFDDASDRRKVGLISEYLKNHPCLFEKTLALSSLHRLHSKICRRFKRAITHVSLLNGRIRATGVRYKKASDANRRSARYVLRMRLAVLEGVRTCFCEYAQEKAEILKEIEQIFVREHSQLSTRSDNPYYLTAPVNDAVDNELDEDDDDMPEEAQEEEEEDD